MKAEIKKKSKAVIIGVLSVCLVATIGIGGTLAFLSDSEQVTNRFSVGDLDITLDEPNWDDDGDGDFDEDDEDDDDDPDNGDGRDLLPGDTRDKDPTVHAVKGDSYMRVVMMIKDSESGEIITDTERLDLILTTIRYAENDAIKEDEHYLLDDIKNYPRVNPAFTEDKTRSTAGTYYYNYNVIFEEGDEVVFFTDIVIPGDWKETELKTLGAYQIVIQAQAIQSENFDSAADAFNALDGEISDETVQQNYGEVGGASDKEFDVVQRSLTV